MAARDLFSFLGNADRSGTRRTSGKRRGNSRNSRSPDAADAAAVKVYLLDVGTEQYGDCVLMDLAGVRVLVDGGHKSNISSHGDAPSIPVQLEHLLGGHPPFKIDLLVVTHCHADHLGCLPELVSQHLIDVRWALVIDEKLGFPHTFADDARVSDGPASRLIAALLEEKRPPSMTDAEIQQFIQDAANIAPRYTGMLDTLKSRHTKIVRYGRNSATAIHSAFAGVGLEILGPSKKQLTLCRDYLKRVGSDAADHLTSQDGVQDLAGEARLYREIIRQWSAMDAGEDQAGPGSGKNDQSLVLKFEVGGAKILLTGDMQFAKPEVSGLDDEMEKLRRAVEQAGPYSFVKIAHHGSYNAFDSSVLAEMGPTKAFATQNGTNDSGHPANAVLQLLYAHRHDVEWARTDRNGLVTVTFPNGIAKLTPTRGHLNDATKNSDLGALVAPGAQPGEGLAPLAGQGAAGTAEFNATARVSDDVGAVTVTFTTTPRNGVGVSTEHTMELQPGSASPSASAPDRAVLAGGRRLPALLFVTHSPALAANIGRQEAARALGLIRASGQRLLDVSHPKSPFGEVREALQDGTDGTYRGVVLVGGYDVLPAQRLDVLDAALRRSLGARVANDADQYVVWSDAIYGDKDGDELPELPVSRIPDGKSAALVMTALAAAPDADNPGRRFGVRNIARPFAQPIFTKLKGRGDLLVSEPITSTRIGTHKAAGDVMYFMLHGSDSDARSFWGEDDDSIVEAFNLGNLANTERGVVFTGCCWGALIVDTTAFNANGQPLGSRVPDSSIALATLRGGALAFIGCTGSHYSPTVAPYGYFGGPMHSAFWKHYQGGKSPVESLFAAKLDYVNEMPHGQTSAEGRAIEMKILRQYTCLGLGW